MRRSGRRWSRSSPRAPAPGSRPSTPRRSSTSTGWPRRTARRHRDLLPRHVSHQSGDRPARSARALEGLPGRQPGRRPPAWGPRAWSCTSGATRGAAWPTACPRWWPPCSTSSDAPARHRLPDPAGERGGDGWHGRAELRRAGDHPRRRRELARAPSWASASIRSICGPRASATPRWRRPTRVVAQFDAAHRADRLRCLHLNDSKVGSGGEQGPACQRRARGPSGRRRWAR